MAFSSSYHPSPPPPNPVKLFKTSLAIVGRSGSAPWACQDGLAQVIGSATGPGAVAGVLARSRSSIDGAAASRHAGLALGSLTVRAIAWLLINNAKTSRVLSARTNHRQLSASHHHSESVMIKMSFVGSSTHPPQRCRIPQVRRAQVCKAVFPHVFPFRMKDLLSFKTAVTKMPNS